MARCRLTCRSCDRECHDAPLPHQSHRFDCCGVVEAHDWVRPDRMKPADEKKNPPRWVRITNPMGAGYMTGPSLTQPKEEALQ